MTIKVIIADDHQLFREGLINLLSETPDIEIIGEASNGKEVLDQVKNLNPEMVLMDIGMPLMNGIETTIQLQKEYPEIKTIALSMHADATFVKRMLEAGADGYLFKNCSYDQLVDALRQVSKGKKYLSSEITEVILQDYIHGDPAPTRHQPRLTERENEVLQYLAEGKSIREISDALFISIKTVGTHKQNIFDKLEIENMAQLVKFAIKNGIVAY